MPGMDGFELVERIKRDLQLCGATIMMLTSSEYQGDAARCRELGIAAYLVKPIRKSELLTAILTVLGHRPLHLPNCLRELLWARPARLFTYSWRKTIASISS